MQTPSSPPSVQQHTKESSPPQQLPQVPLRKPVKQKKLNDIPSPQRVRDDKRSPRNDELQQPALAPSKQQSGEHNRKRHGSLNHRVFQKFDQRGQTTVDDFIINKKLGSGAYSSVYHVTRKADGKSYALKKVRIDYLSEKERANAINEVRILASVCDPNVISYKEVFVDKNYNSLCIVMEFADDGDLYQKILHHQSEGTMFDEENVWRLLIQIVSGLKSLHDFNIMHRDIKSANIFMYKDFCCKLGDMNVSKLADANGLNYTQTGTPYYASPEVWRDEPYDLKSDIWSLGCVVYEMVTLKPPFQADDMQGLFKSVLRGHYKGLPSSYSTDLCVVIAAMLKTTAAKRPTCAELIRMPEFLERAQLYYPHVVAKIMQQIDTEHEMRIEGGSREGSLSLQEQHLQTSQSQQIRPELMKTIFFTNRERIMIGNDHVKYMTYLQRKLPAPSYETALAATTITQDRSKSQFQTTAGTVSNVMEYGSGIAKDSSRLQEKGQKNNILPGVSQKKKSSSQEPQKQGSTESTGPRQLTTLKQLQQSYAPTLKNQRSDSTERQRLNLSPSKAAGQNSQVSASYGVNSPTPVGQLIESKERASPGDSLARDSSTNSNNGNHKTSGGLNLPSINISPQNAKATSNANASSKVQGRNSPPYKDVIMLKDTMLPRDPYKAQNKVIGGSEDPTKHYTLMSNKNTIKSQKSIGMISSETMTPTKVVKQSENDSAKKGMSEIVVPSSSYETAAVGDRQQTRKNYNLPSQRNGQAQNHIGRVFNAKVAQNRVAKLRAHIPTDVLDQESHLSRESKSHSTDKQPKPQPTRQQVKASRYLAEKISGINQNYASRANGPYESNRSSAALILTTSGTPVSQQFDHSAGSSVRVTPSNVHLNKQNILPPQKNSRHLANSQISVVSAATNQAQDMHDGLDPSNSIPRKKFSNRQRATGVTSIQDLSHSQSKEVSLPSIKPVKNPQQKQLSNSINTRAPTQINTQVSADQKLQSHAQSQIALANYNGSSFQINRRNNHRQIITNSSNQANQAQQQMSPPQQVSENNYGVMLAKQEARGQNVVLSQPQPGSSIGQPKKGTSLRNQLQQVSYRSNGGQSQLLRNGSVSSKNALHNGQLAPRGVPSRSMLDNYDQQSGSTVVEVNEGYNNRINISKSRVQGSSDQGVGASALQMSTINKRSVARGGQASSIQRPGQPRRYHLPQQI